VTRYCPALLALAFLFAAAPAWATTPSTTPDCAEHGHDAEHNPHCDEPTTTTTTTLLPLPSNPTTTTSEPATTTTTTAAPSLSIEPPHLNTPATPTTTTVPEVLSTHVDRLPRTGTPIRFLTICAGLCLLGGAAAFSARRVKRGARTM